MRPNSYLLFAIYTNPETQNMAWHLRQKPSTTVRAIKPIRPIKPIQPLKPIKPLRPLKPLAPIGYEYYWRD